MKTQFITPVIDFEASGFGHSSYPIEVGLILNDGSSYQTLIKPLYNWTHWSGQSSEVHHLKRTDLLKYGKTPKQVCIELNQFCAGRVLYTDCWAHDQHWLNRLFDSVGVACDFRLSPIEYRLSQDQMESWVENKKKIAQKFNIESHRALNDAIIISHTIEYILNQPRSPECTAANQNQHLPPKKFNINSATNNAKKLI